MKTIIRILPVLICSGVLGCSATVPHPLRYVAVAQPATIPPPLQVKGEQVELSKTRVLPNIRLPRDAAEFLGELQTKTGEPVLRNADLNLTTSICFLVCVNTDTATAERAR